MSRRSNPIRDMILAMRAPEMTLEFVELHNRIAQAEADGTLDDELFTQCPDGECIVCAQIVCPFGDALHLHHDGCPSCSAAEPKALCAECDEEEPYHRPDCSAYPEWMRE